MLHTTQLVGFGTMPKPLIHKMYRFTGSGGPYLTRTGELTSDADAKTGTIAFWCQFHGGDNSNQHIFNINNDFWVNRTAANKLAIVGQTSAEANCLSIATSSSITVSTGLFHCVASWSLSAAATHLYINGSSNIVIATASNSNINYASGASSELRVGIRPGTGSTFQFDGCLGGLYMSRTYIDLSNAANLAKFYSTAFPDNVPTYAVDLGADGSTPESAQPILYLNSSSDFATNLGTGGNFTKSGSLGVC